MERGAEAIHSAPPAPPGGGACGDRLIDERHSISGHRGADLERHQTADHSHYRGGRGGEPVDDRGGRIHDLADDFRGGPEGRQKEAPHRVPEALELGAHQLEAVLRGVRSGRVLGEDRGCVRFVTGRERERGAVLIEIADDLGELRSVLLPEEVGEHRHLVLGRPDRVEQTENCALGVSAEVFLEPFGAETEAVERILELLGSVLRIGQDREHPLDRGRGDVGRGFERDHRRAERAHLLPGQTEQLPHRPRPGDDLEDGGRGRVHVVCEVVVGAGEVERGRLAEPEDVPEPGHRPPGLAGGHVERNAHHRRVPREVQELGAGDAGLSAGRDDLRETGGRNRDPGGHLLDGAAHRPELFRAVEIHHLAHVGHRRLEIDGAADRELERPQKRRAEGERVDETGAGLGPTRAGGLDLLGGALELVEAPGLLRELGGQLALAIGQVLDGVAGRAEVRAPLVERLGLLLHRFVEATHLLAGLLQRIPHPRGGLIALAHGVSEGVQPLAGLDRRLPGRREGVFERADFLDALQAFLESLDRLAEPFDVPYRGAGGRPDG